MRNFGDRLDVDHLKHRIGRRFQKEGLGVGPHRLAPLIEIGAVDQGRGYTVAGQVLFHHVETRAEQRLRGNNVISGAHLPHQGGGDCRHPGRGRACSLCAFEGGHPLLEHRDRRIGEAGILIPRLLVLEPLLRAG